MEGKGVSKYAAVTNFTIVILNRDSFWLRIHHFDLVTILCVRLALSNGDVRCPARTYTCHKWDTQPGGGKGEIDCLSGHPNRPNVLDVTPEVSTVLHHGSGKERGIPVVISRLVVHELFD